MIRTANFSDLSRLVQMGRRFRSETKYEKYLAENPDKMRELGEQLVRQDGLLISEQNGEPTGMLGFVNHSHFISGDRVTGEVFWWVEPERRGDGLRLVRETENRARAGGSKYIQMIAPTDQVARIYSRIGYEKVEETWQKTL